MQTIITVLAALAIFGFFIGALLLGRLFGRVRKRRCACAEAQNVMKQVADRKAAARSAARYRPESVNPSELPILPESLSGGPAKENE